MNNLIPIGLYHGEGNRFGFWWILMVMVLSVFESITVGDSAIFLKFITHTFNTHTCHCCSCLTSAPSVILSVSLWDKWLTRRQKRENIPKQRTQCLSVYYETLILIHVSRDHVIVMWAEGMRRSLSLDVRFQLSRLWIKSLKEDKMGGHYVTLWAGLSV